MTLPNNSQIEKDESTQIQSFSTSNRDKILPSIDKKRDLSEA
jgi:hypothetical protein